MVSPDDFIMLSALQHYAFCPRQCALIHIEQIWTENRLTAEGRILHERVHEEGSETRGDVRIERGVSLRSTKLGLIGKADVTNITDSRMEAGKLSPWNTNAANPNRMIVTRFSFARRQCAWKKCYV